MSNLKNAEDPILWCLLHGSQASRWLAGDQVDERCHAVMTRSLVQFAIVFLKMENVERSESAAQQRCSIHVFDLRWTAGCVVELFRPVSLKKQKSTRRNGATYARKDTLS